MEATTKALFGAAPAVERATTGSYGEAPSGFRLPTATRLGAAHLQVADLARSLAFYEGTLGFRVTDRTPKHAALSAHGDSRVLIELHERAGAKPAGRRALLGLYHVAILLPDRPALGRFLRRMNELRVPVGAGDHLVSEALYLSDPDGLGLEVYADRPRETWQRSGRELMLATDPVDVASLVEAAGPTPWTGMPAGTSIGHVHLHVGNLAEGARFYAEAVGFDKVTWRYPGALFLGAGGYHHHLGTNTWAGPHAASAADDDARLTRWTIELPYHDAVAAVTESLAKGGYETRREGALTLARDPWGTEVAFTVRDTR